MTTTITVKATDYASLRQGLISTEVELKPEPKKKYRVELKDKANTIRYTNKLTKLVDKEVDGEIIEVEVPRFSKKAIITELKN